MSEIKTKIFNRGDSCESTWPSDYGTRESGRWYWDESKQKMVKGNPPIRHEKSADAPMIIMDSIDPYYHPAAGIWVESRSQLAMCDKATGSITTDKLIPADSSQKKAREAARRKDLTECLHKAVALVDSGNAPLTEEVRQLCERQNELTSQRLNFDAFNVAGRKTNGKGKKYRRK